MNVLRIEVRDCGQGINRVAPDLGSLGRRQRPEFLKGRRVREMRPQRVIVDNARQRRPGNMLDDCFLFHEIKARRAIKGFQIPVLVQVFDGASDVVEFAHQVVMSRTNEYLGPALELLSGLARGGQDETVDATTILMGAVHNLARRPGFGVDMQCPEQPPMAT